MKHSLVQSVLIRLSPKGTYKPHHWPIHQLDAAQELQIGKN